MASEALRMVINLEVDESLQSNYTQYQQQQSNPNNTTQQIQTQSTQQCIFPKQLKMFPWNDIQQITQYIYQQTRYVKYLMYIYCELIILALNFSFTLSFTFTIQNTQKFQQKNNVYFFVEEK